MMSAIGDQPVMWVNVKSLVAQRALRRDEHGAVGRRPRATRARKYPNMRVYDWASVVKDAWFIPDGIHYTSPGYAARAQLIAEALAKAFPADGSESPTCVVHA